MCVYVYCLVYTTESFFHKHDTNHLWKYFKNCKYYFQTNFSHPDKTLWLRKILLTFFLIRFIMFSQNSQLNTVGRKLNNLYIFQKYVQISQFQITKILLFWKFSATRLMSLSLISLLQFVAKQFVTFWVVLFLQI